MFESRMMRFGKIVFAPGCFNAVYAAELRDAVEFSFQFLGVCGNGQQYVQLHDCISGSKWKNGENTLAFTAASLQHGTHSSIVIARFCSHKWGDGRAFRIAGKP